VPWVQQRRESQLFEVREPGAGEWANDAGRVARAGRGAPDASDPEEARALSIRRRASSLQLNDYSARGSSHNLLDLRSLAVRRVNDVSGTLGDGGGAAVFGELVGA
jgi:hypothetical protein